MSNQPDWFVWIGTQMPMLQLVLLFNLAIFVGWISTKLTSSESYKSLFAFL